MLFHLLYGALGDKIGWLRVFRYTSTRILAAAITALLLSFILGPWFIERLKARQIGETIRDRRPADPQEEGRHADDGRLADPVLPRGLDAAVVRPAQPVRVARADRHRRVRRDRLRRRLRQGREEEQEGHLRQAAPRPRVRDRRRRDGVPVLLEHDARRTCGCTSSCRSPTSTSSGVRAAGVAVRDRSARSSSSAPRTRSTSPTGSTASRSARRS